MELIKIMAAWSAQIHMSSLLEGIMRSKAISIHTGAHKIKVITHRTSQACLAVTQIWVEA